MTMLDKRQAKLHTYFPDGHWMSKPAHIERLIDWTTFYRRNLPAFIEHYLQISLYMYQVICLYLLNLFGSVGIVAARASAKSFIIAIFACAKCILYPKSRIVIASSTKGQAALIVKEKIEKELMPKSETLRREIESIVVNNAATEVNFHNGSSIVVVAANENSRGYRGTGLVLEEFRNIKKAIADKVLRPFLVSRQADYVLKFPEYQNLTEEPINIYISSSGTTSEWIWDTCKELVDGYYKDHSSCLVAMDYSIALRHNIKTRAQIMADKRTFDSLTFRIEYENEMLRENTNAFFSYQMLASNQRLKKCFYPKRDEDISIGKKNPYAIPKQPGEIRIVSCDIALVNKRRNDNSVFSCLRLLPETIKMRGDSETTRGYRRACPYIEARPGGDVDEQAIRIKQLFYDFEADYVVLDTRNGGIFAYDRLAKVLYDENRDVEYRAWTCINDDSIAQRVTVYGADPVVFVINGNAKLNSDIALCFRDVLETKRIDFLIPLNEAVDTVLQKNIAYNSAPDGETMVFYERPYLETQQMISETIALEYERGEQTGVYRVFEVGKNTKDRYTSLSYGNWFASLLEQDLLSDTSDCDYVPLAN